MNGLFVQIMRVKLFTILRRRHSHNSFENSVKIPQSAKRRHRGDADNGMVGGAQKIARIVYFLLRHIRNQRLPHQLIEVGV